MCKIWCLLPELEDSSFLAGVVLVGAGLAAGFFAVSSSELESSEEDSLATASLTGTALAGVTLAGAFWAEAGCGTALYAPTETKGDCHHTDLRPSVQYVRHF